MNETPSASRIHIGFFGRRNAGKSSLVNAVAGQSVAVVSDVPGTTTDPVPKSMELLPLGPVVLLDTPGFDDEGALGELRVARTRRELNRTDIAVLVVDATLGLGECERELERLIQEKNIPYLVVWNKCDLGNNVPNGSIATSSKQGTGIQELKERLGSLAPKEAPRHLVADLVPPGSTVVLVVPIDESAPKGRLILPQQQAIRDLLEAGDLSLVVRDTELPQALASLAKPPALVLTDSQAFASVAKNTPATIPLTSFSILMARFKGYLETALRGISAMERLHNGSRVLIAEGCTHHRQCNDIGTVKIPNWLRKHTGAILDIETCSGNEFPADLSPYDLVIHCGGCMLTEREVLFRMKCANDQNVPFLNYGVAIAYMLGILHRALSIRPDLQKQLPETGRC
ncbi:MAG: [Victivallales bacterium]|nr:[FeFe] hydrogenase H-cluster maturation GTPase HydF [Victivallales bacterium]